MKYIIYINKYIGYIDKIILNAHTQTTCYKKYTISSTTTLEKGANS